MVRAAVLTEPGSPLHVDEITLPEPGPGQVRVRLAAAGVCHSDLSLSNGTLRQPVPAVLGHEGAGTVTAVGDDVTHVSPGDPVLLNWAPSCGGCWWCRRGEVWLCEHAADAASRPYAALADGTELYAGLGTAAFADETLVPAHGALPLPQGTDLSAAALLGCAVMTGVGAVLNTAAVQPGDAVLVIGLGGVGLSAVQGARLAQAGTVIAVDVTAAKEELARRLGATDFLVAGPDLAKEVRRLTDGRGVDHAFECVGRPETLRAAWSATRRGGQLVVVGIGSKNDTVQFSALELFHFGRTIRGCVFGSSNPVDDVPMLLEHVAAGRLDVGALVTDRITLDDIPAAFERMAAGQGARSLVVY